MLYFYLLELRDFNLKGFSECLDLDHISGLNVTIFFPIFDIFMNAMYNTVKKRWVNYVHVYASDILEFVFPRQ